MCSYTALLREAFNLAGAGRGLFFSFDADVTLTQQRCVCTATARIPGICCMSSDFYSVE
jgi:hypothetical protein